VAVANEKKVKIVGMGHSPSNIACTNEYMISFKNLNKILDVDKSFEKIKTFLFILKNKINHFK